MFTRLKNAYATLAGYTRVALGWGIFLWALCLLLAALLRRLAPAGDYLELLRLARGFAEAAPACLAAAVLPGMICEAALRTTEDAE